MYSPEEELDEMVARVARHQLRMPARPMGGRSVGLARARVRPRFGIGHDACGCGTGCGGACDCGCVSCGGARARHEADESGGLSAAGNATPATAAGAQLPAWRGWSPPVRLSTLIAADGTPARNLNREFFDRGSRVYRITRAGIDTARPLNIGMTISNSIYERMMEHFRGSRGDPNVRRAFGTMTADRILVQAGLLDRNGMHPRRAKSYENWLQDRERPALYSPDTTTFETADDINVI